MFAIKDDGLDLHTIILLNALSSPSLPPSALHEQNHITICPDFSAWAVPGSHHTLLGAKSETFLRLRQQSNSEAEAGGL